MGLLGQPRLLALGLAATMGMIKLIIPSKLLVDTKGLLKAIDNGMKATAKGIAVDFKVTTQTWKHKPKFETESTGPLGYIVGTDDDIYNFVSGGTRPHIITPKNGKVLTWVGAAYRPKTAPRVIGSKKGGNDNTIVYTKIVHHPGNKARDFEFVIAEKWQKEIGTIVQRAIDAEVS